MYQGAERLFPPVQGDIVVVDDPKTVWYHDFPSDLAEKFAARVETHSIVYAIFDP